METVEQKRRQIYFRSFWTTCGTAWAGGKGLEAAEKRRLQKENEKRADLSDLV